MELLEVIKLSGLSPNEFIPKYWSDAYRFLRNRNPQGVLLYPPRDFEDKLEYVSVAIAEGFMPIEIGLKLRDGYKSRPPTAYII